MNDAGRIGFVIKGDYDSTVTYDFLDTVYFNGVTYVAKKLTVGNSPDNSEFWQVLVDGYIDINDVAPTFVEAETRENIISNETIPTLFGKIKKFFGDLKTVAFTGSYADLSEKPTKADIGLGNVNNTADANKSVKYATSAGSATKATQDGNGKNIASTYIPKTNILNTVEAVDANTSSDNVAGALGVKAINNNMKNSISTLNSNLNNVSSKIEGIKTIYSNSDPSTYNRMKYLIDNKKLPLNKPFAMIEGSYGNVFIAGQIYADYKYGEFFCIEHDYSGIFRVFTLDNGILRTYRLSNTLEIQ